ncbi:MAG: MFS transporter [Candidatus Bathyarchaeota archaeon]|nr:MFS transporter [Candidatus Bathyarchaeota archaeon]
MTKANYWYLSYLAGSHIMIHVYSTLLPVLLLPFQDELKVSLVQLSLLASIPLLVNVLIYIPVGILADRHPAKVLTASFAITAAGAFAIPLSYGFEMLLFGFTLLSVGSTLYHPPSLKMASEYSKDKVSLAMGIHNMGSNIGFAAGPLLLGFLLTGYGWRISFYIWGILTVAVTGLTWIYTTRNLKDTEASTRRFNLSGGFRVIFTREFLLVIIMAALIEAAMNNISTFTPLYFTKEIGMSYSLTSIVSGLAPLAGIAGSFAGGLTGDKFGKYRVAMLVALVLGVVFLAMLSTTLFLLIVGYYTFYRFLQAAFMPLLNSIIVDHSNRENLSLCFSFTFVVVSLVGSAATTGLSILIESFGPRILFPTSVAVLIPCIAMIHFLSRRGQKANR